MISKGVPLEKLGIALRNYVNSFLSNERNWMVLGRRLCRLER